MSWPRECLESEEHFGHYLARFYPLLPTEIYAAGVKQRRPGRKVMTPKGRGTCHHALAGWVGVVLDDERRTVAYGKPTKKDPPRMRYFRMESVEPVGP